MQPLQETFFWDAPFSHQYEWGCLPQFSTELPSTVVARCRSADCDSVTIHAWWRRAAFSSRCLGILEERVSGTRVARGGPTVWPACFSDCIPLHFDLLGHLMCTVCATDVCEYQDLGLGFEMIGKSCSFRVCLTVTVQTRNVLHGNSTWTLREIFNLQGAVNPKTMFQKACGHKLFCLVLWCRCTFCRFSHSFSLYPVHLQYKVLDILCPYQIFHIVVNGILNLHVQ